MKLMGLAAIVFVLFGVSAKPGATQDDDVDLVELAERYCITPDGDHRLTWHLAERDGFSWLSADAFSDLSLPSSVGQHLRGLGKVVDGREVRVLTSAFSWTAPDDGHSYFRQCWVSASDYDVGRATRDTGSLLGVRHFKSKEVYLYAWVPQTDGSRRSVSRRDYRRRHLALAREEGLRQVSLRQYGRAVFIGYTSPRDEATYREFDWAGPEPVPARR